MEEKRRYKRLKIDLYLNISELFKQDNVKVENIQAPIEVVDISKTGIGFVAESILPLNYYFNAKLQLGDSKSTLHCVVCIVRKKDLPDGTYQYGCEFVGLAPILYYIFDEYEASLDKDKDYEC
ncbi:MAG: PilZ domain-containing protein [Acetivibrio sp.]